MISPHYVLETITKLGPRHSIWRTAKALPPVVELLRRAVLFQFNEIRPDVTHQEFAVDLYGKGLFTLPFPVSAFSISGKQETTLGPARASGMMVLSQMEDGTLGAVMCNELRDRDGITYGAVPIASIHHASFEAASGTQANVTSTVLPLIGDDLMRAMYGDAGEVGHRVLEQRVLKNLMATVGMVVMLMSKGIDAKREPAPDKLNRARAKKGKPPIGERYVITINAGALHTISTEGGDESIAGHTRGSPRPHWRRGTFRTIHRGTERERVVPVAPCLVAADGIAAEAVRKKAYIVNP